MKKLVALLMALLLVFSLAACGAKEGTSAPSAETAPAAQKEDTKEEVKEAAPTNEGKTIVYLAPSLDILYWQWVEAGVKQACEAAGAVCVTYVSENDAAKQLNNCNTAIVQGVDGIVLSPVSSPSCTPVLDACEEAGIPVTIAAIGPDEGVSNYACLVTADDYTSGYENGKFLCEKVLAAGGGTIGVLSLPLDRTNAQAKMAGLELACEEMGVEICQVLQTQNLTVNVAVSQANDLLTAHKDMKGIYGMYEQAGIGAVTAVEDNGLQGEIFIVSSDGSPESIAMIREGRMDGIVVQEAVGQGLVATEQLLLVINGGKVTEKDIPLPEPLVTTGNVDDPEIQEVLRLVYPESAGAY